MDYYDKAVEYFRRYPQRIELAWIAPMEVKGGKLFSFCDATRRGFSQMPNGKACGCPKMIHDEPEHHEGQTDAITEVCREATWLARGISEYAVDVLPEYAKLQRRIDAELGRTPPVWEEQDEF